MVNNTQQRKDILMILKVKNSVKPEEEMEKTHAVPID